MIKDISCSSHISTKGDMLEYQLKTFNRLIKKIENLLKKAKPDNKTLEQFKKSIAEEHDISIDYVKDIYHEAELIFPDTLVKQLDKIINFHKKIIENRKDYLQTTISKLLEKIKLDEIKLEKYLREAGKLKADIDSYKSNSSKGKG